VTSTVVDAGDGLPLTVGRLLAERAAERGDHALLVCDDDRLSYADADRHSAVLARGLLATGVGRGSHVGILQPNGSDFVVAWLAAARIGAVALPLSTFSTGPELAGLIAGADIRTMLSAAAYRSHRYAETLAAGLPDLDLTKPPPLLSTTAPTLRDIRFTTVDSGFDPGWSLAALLDAAEQVGEDGLAAVEAEVAPADRMVIVHTSGSTSAPKGVVHTHGALIRHLHNLNELRRYARDEVLFSNSPFFWIGGFAYGLLGTLVAGATLVCSNATAAADVLDLIERERPTMVNGFAASVAHLADDPSFAERDLSSIRRGNLWPIMPDDVRPADPELRHGMLGMTEAGSVVLVSDDEGELPEHQRGSFGRPAPGFETRIVDPDTGAVCGVEEVGELWLRGPFMMEGYYGLERSAAFDADGWYHSGDLVRVDADGFHYFHGRHGDMIKTAGANVSPREVEAAIAEATGLRSHVIGIDDATRGQLVAAAIVRPDRGSVDVDAVRAALTDRLSAYKIPKVVQVVSAEEIPMMSSGKLDLRALKAMLGDR
jgi:acyl-CoA synthetase (AMP-forming)/AMP-acid ligase II